MEWKVAIKQSWASVLSFSALSLISLAALLVKVIARIFQGLTFTNKAAREMRERAEKLKMEAQDCLIATFHSMCVRILRREADHIGYNRNFTIVDPGEQRTLMKRILKNLNLDPKKWNERAILGTISNAKNDLIDEVAYANLAGDMYTEIVAKCYTIYQKELRQSEAMDFDDLIMLTLRLFDQNPDVLTYYQQRYQYIHVDEYQDTNHAKSLTSWYWAWLVS